MPRYARKSYARKRRFYRRRYPKSKAVTYTGLRKTLHMYGAIPKNKYNDYTDQFTFGSNTQVADNIGGGYTPWSVYAANLVRIAAGDQVDDRNSNIIQLKKLDLRMLLQASVGVLTTNTVPPYQVRIMLVVDTQQGGDDNILNDSTTTSVSPNIALASLLQHTSNSYLPVVSPLNVTANRGRYKVLYDRVKRFVGQNYVVPTSEDPYGQAYSLKDIVVRKTLRFKKPLSVYFNGDTAGDIQKNGIYLVLFNDSTVNDVSPTVTNLIVRNVFVDNQ